MMNPVIVDLHHEVLIPWSELRRNLPAAPQVITFDFHTDTMPCDRRGNVQPQPGDWQDPEKVLHAVQSLHHDEHFDWAIRADLVSEVIICATALQNGPCAHERMRVLRSSVFPEINALLHEPEKYRALADGMLQDECLSEVLKDVSLRKPWILDIDCDFCFTQKTLDFSDGSIFAELIRKADLITLSLESDWVRLLRFPGEMITGESIAARIQDHCSRLRKE